MGVTIAAVLIAALILPGIVALAAFYNGISTAEVRLAPPPLGTVISISAVGAAALFAHLVWSALLLLNDGLPALLPLPPADPYTLIFAPQANGLAATSLFAGMLGFAWSIVIGAGIGWLAARGEVKSRNRILFGWLYPILEKARPAENYINAYVLSNLTCGKDTLGYEGTVQHLALDEQLAITGVTLVNVSTFYLRMDEGGATRISAHSKIHHLALRDTDYQNIALVVIRYETPTPTPTPPSPSPPAPERRQGPSPGPPRPEA